MAKILLGPTVIGIRGTVGGITFSQNRGGPYARGWHKPTNPKTTSQRTAQNNLATWATLWRTLTAGQKTGWINYAAAAAQQLTDSLGQPYYASGFNWYITINVARAQMGIAATPTAPVNPTPAAPTSPTLLFRTSINANNTEIAYQAGDPNIALYKGIFAYVANSQGVRVAPVTSFYMITATVNVSNRIPFKTQQNNKFGTTTSQQRMYAYTYNLSAEGRASSYVYLADNGRDAG